VIFENANNIEMIQIAPDGKYILHGEFTTLNRNNGRIYPVDYLNKDLKMWDRRIKIRILFNL
jgi:hypothetical protein